MKQTAKQYVQKYFDMYKDGNIDDETYNVATFLIKNAIGKVLDCGCGPVPQNWSICMPYMQELSAIDLPKESISLVKQQITSASKWYKNYIKYQRLVEKTCDVKLSNEYIL